MQKLLSGIIKVILACVIIVVIIVIFVHHFIDALRFMLLALFHCNHVEGMQILLADFDALSGGRLMKRNIRHFLLMINLFFPPIDLMLTEPALH
jgi:hypothetical protein